MKYNHVGTICGVNGYIVGENCFHRCIYHFFHYYSYNNQQHLQLNLQSISKESSSAADKLTFSLTTKVKEMMKYD